jgi:hypothetical protein
MLKRESEIEVPEFKVSVGKYVRLKGRVHPDAKGETGVEVVSVDEERSRVLVRTSDGSIKSYSKTFVDEVLEPPVKSVDDVDTIPVEVKGYESVYDNLEVLFDLYGLTPKPNSFLADTELEKFETLFLEGREQEILSYLISYSKYIEEDVAYIKYLWEYEFVPKMKATLIRLGYPEKSIEGYFDRTEYRFDNTELLSETELINDFEEYLLDKYLPTGYEINQFDKVERTYKSAVQLVLVAVVEDDFSNLEKGLDSLLESESPETMADLRKVERQQESQFTPDDNSALIVNTPEAPKKSVGVPLKDQLKEVIGEEFTVPRPVSSEITVAKAPEVFSPWKAIKMSRGGNVTPQKPNNSYTEGDLVGEGKFHVLSVYTPKLNEKGKGGFDWVSNVGLPKPTGVDKAFLQPPKITMLRGEQSGITMKLEWYVVQLVEKTGKSKDAGSLSLATSYFQIGQVKIKDGVVDAKLPDSDWDKLLTALLSLNRLRDGSGKGIEYSIVTDYTEAGKPIKFPLNTPEVFPGKLGIDFSGIRYLDYLSEPQFSVLLKDYRPKLSETLDIGARIWILALLAFSFQSNKEYVAKELNIPYNEEQDGDIPPFKFIYKGLGQKFQLPESFMIDLGLKERPKTFFDRNPYMRDLQ